MLNVRPAREVVLRLPNEIGTLNRIAKTLSDKGIDILATSAWVEGEQVVIRLLTGETSRTADALRAHGWEPREVEVIVTELPHKPGMLRRLTESLAQDEIDIHHLYATAAPAQEHCLLVFATANNDRAIVRLNSAWR
jgi:hypothetical protein